jgi:hypothetical protein
MAPSHVTRRRMRASRLTGSPFTSADEVVRWHLAMQSQDYAEGHRNSDHLRDLPIHESVLSTEHVRPQGLEHARDTPKRRFLSLRHSSLGWRASPLARCEPVRS